jgi:hypothetical protein
MAKLYCSEPLVIMKTAEKEECATEWEYMWPRSGHIMPPHIFMRPRRHPAQARQCAVQDLFGERCYRQDKSFRVNPVSVSVNPELSFPVSVSVNLELLFSVSVYPNSYSHTFP